MKMGMKKTFIKPIISKFNFFHNFADNLTNADLLALALDNLFPLYHWPLMTLDIMKLKTYFCSLMEEKYHSLIGSDILFLSSC